MINTKLPIWRYAPISKLTLALKSSGGRNNQGRIVTFHRGAHHKIKYRIIDFRRRFPDIPAIVLRLEHNPSYSAPLVLIVYSNGILSYILAAKDLKARAVISSGLNAQILPGCSTMFKRIPMGQPVHNIENVPGLGGTFVRAAGTKAQILRKKKNFSILRLPSGELRAFNELSYATIGAIETSKFFKSSKTKAGNNRWLGKRPVVRGVAMNPIDHPHGGGEGKTSGGRPSCSPWGILTKGYKTRNARKSFVHVIRTRHLQKQKFI